MNRSIIGKEYSLSLRNWASARLVFLCYCSAVTLLFKVRATTAWLREPITRSFQKGQPWLTFNFQQDSRGLSDR